MPELVLDALTYSGLLALSVAPLQLAFGRRRAPRRRWATDLAFATFGQVITHALTLLGGGLLLAKLDAAVRQPHLAEVGVLPVPLQLALGLLLFELGGYAYHRLAHAWGPLQRLHAVHHSAEEMDLLAGFRQHPFEVLLMTLCQNAPLVLLGVSLGEHALVVALLRAHNLFVHSTVRVPRGPWSQLLAMPDFHHRHHDRDGRLSNYASLFPWLDRLFGTHAADDALAFGTRAAMPQGFVGLLLHPFRKG